MNLLKKQLKNWKFYVVIIEIALLFYFSSNIVQVGGVSGENFILTIVFLSAILNTFFFIIFSIYNEGSYQLFNKTGKVLSLLNFIYTSLAFGNIVAVGTHWIPALISTLFVSGLALQFYIGLGSLKRIKRVWLFRLNSFLIILVTFYGIFLLILKSERGIFHDTFYIGIVLVFLLSLVSNVINFNQLTPEKD